MSAAYALFSALPPEEQMERLTLLAKAGLQHYGLPEDTQTRLLNLSENATFLVESPSRGQRSILRLHRPGYHTRGAILSELKWLRCLADHPYVRTAQARPGADGELIQNLEHPAVPGARYAVMFDFLPGQEPNPKDLHSMEQLGAVTAHLHDHVLSWPESERLVRHTWDLDSMFFGDAPLWGRWQDGVGVEGERVDLLDRLARRIRERLERYGKTAYNFGLIHADLRLANLLLHEGKVQVIDFDDCGYSWFLYDLASALSFIEAEPQVPGLISSWLRGYEAIRPLRPEDRAEIPTFIMARRLLLTAWVGSHQEAPFARQLGEGFTVGTCELAERYLTNERKVFA